MDFVVLEAHIIAILWETAGRFMCFKGSFSELMNLKQIQQEATYFYNYYHSN